MRRVKRALKILMLAVLAAPLWVRAAEDHHIFLWMIDDNRSEPWVSDSDPSLGPYYIDEIPYRPSSEYPDAKVTSAKVRVTSATGDLPVYLEIYDQKMTTHYSNQTLPMTYQDDVGAIQAGPVWTDFGDYVGEGNTFQVELGFYDGDKWVVMATSETVDYQELFEQGHTSFQALDYPNHGPWQPTFTIPEPSSGLLLLIGTALLALKRKQDNQE